jgi:hypothetical protein
MKIEINEKTRMMRNRQVTGEKGWQLAGNRDLTGFLPRGGNYELRMTNDVEERRLQTIKNEKKKQGKEINKQKIGGRQLLRAGAGRRYQGPGLDTRDGKISVIV